MSYSPFIPLNDVTHMCGNTREHTGKPMGKKSARNKDRIIKRRKKKRRSKFPADAMCENDVGVEHPRKGENKKWVGGVSTRFLHPTPPYSSYMTTKFLNFFCAGHRRDDMVSIRRDITWEMMTDTVQLYWRFDS